MARWKNLEEPFHLVEYSQAARYFARRAVGRHRQAPGRVRFPRATPRPEHLDGVAPSLVWVGHASWIIRLGGLCLYVDPVWSERLGGLLQRNMAPGIALEEAPRPDAILITHNHRDHLDAPTIDRLAALHGRTGERAPTVIVPAGNGVFFRRRGFERVVELEWWQSHALASAEATATVTLVPAQHWSQRGPLDRNEGLWGGFVVEGSGKRVYHAGDTARFSGFGEIGRRFPGIDAALLPIGAYDPEWFMRRQHMNPEDAMEAFCALGARLFCAMHFGTFKLTDEPLDEPPMLLEALRRDRGLDPARVWVPAFGESRGL